MICQNAVVTTCFLATTFVANAHVPVVTPTPTTSLSVTNMHLVTITSSPSLQHDLQLRQEKDDWTCGFKIGNTEHAYTCKSDWLCTNTIIWNQQNYDAYLYCSPSGVATVPQYEIWTTAVSSCDASQLGDPLVGCCSGGDSLAATNYIIKSGYTVTDFDCTDAPPLSATYTPQKNVLNPPEFNKTLAQSEPSPQLSSNAKIGIGIGVGLVGGILLAIGIMFWIRQRKAQRGSVGVSEGHELARRDRAHG